jgi:hypothetical protein
MPSGVQISSDDLSILAHTERWHDAMRRMGRAAVEAELQRRPGHPAELMDDIGGEPPYPTREFCERWCTEQDNALFQFSPRMAVVLGLLVLILASLVMARGDFASMSAGSALGRGGRSAATGDASGARAAPGGIFDVPSFQPVMPSLQQQHQQQQQQQQQELQQQQMRQFMQNTQPPQPTQ